MRLPTLKPIPQWREVFRSLAKADGGSTAVEFGVVGTLTILILLIGIEFAHLMFIQAVLDDAVIEAARFGATGNNTQGNRTAYTTALIQGTGWTSTAVVTITPYKSWTDLSTQTPDTSVDPVYGNAGAPGEVVVYSASYTDSVVNSFADLIPKMARQGNSDSTNSKIYISASTVIQNEPYFRY